MRKRDAEFNELLGETLIVVIGMEAGSEQVVLRTASGRLFVLSHQPECCESVQVEDVSGDARDLIGSPLVQAECVSNSEDPLPDGHDAIDSYTWTFYKFGTEKGFVMLRWLGVSNGCYSEGVDFHELLDWMEGADDPNPT